MAYAGWRIPGGDFQVVRIAISYWALDLSRVVKPGYKAWSMTMSLLNVQLHNKTVTPGNTESQWFVMREYSI